MIKVQDPASRQEIWITPGGALEPDESEEVGLRRELEEETGLQNVEVGPLIWTRTHTFDWNHRTYQLHEKFYLVKTVAFEPTMEGNPEDGERSAFRGFRWWSVEDLRNSSDCLAPGNICKLMDGLIQHGPAAKPFDIISMEI